MSVRQIVPTAQELDHFVKLEQKILGGEPRYVSETLSDVRKRLKGRSAFHEGVESALFLTGDDEPTARVAAFVNRRYQAAKREMVGFIGYFAAPAEADSDVKRILEEAEDWLRHRGVTRVVAPVNAAGLVGLGLLTDAYDEDPMFPLAWHPPRYATYLEAAGYRPTYPLWIYEIDFSSDSYRTTARRALASSECTVRPINKRRWKGELETFRRVFNEGFSDEWEFHPYSLAEFQELYGPMKPVLDPKQMLIAERNGEPVGICLGLPDWTPLFRSFRGKMGPLQVVRLLRGARRFTRAGLIGIAVLRSHRGQGIGQTLMAALYRRYEQLGLLSTLYYPVNDANMASRRLAESFGGRGRCLYHCYDKPL